MARAPATAASMVVRDYPPPPAASSSSGAWLLARAKAAALGCCCCCLDEDAVPQYYREVGDDERGTHLLQAEEGAYRAPRSVPPPTVATPLLASHRIDEARPAPAPPPARPPRTTSSSSILEDDDACCPTCLEPYTADNPRIGTRCGHHYHLGCIYEWLERSESCPVCGRFMQFDELTASEPLPEGAGCPDASAQESPLVPGLPDASSAKS